MLSLNIPGKDKTQMGYSAELSGDTLTVWPIQRTIGVGAKLVCIKDEKMSWEAEWDFETHSISVSELKFPKEVIPFLEKHFGDTLKELEPERQEPLFKDGCTVCGAKEVHFPHQAMRDGYGDIIGGSPPEKVRWECSVCTRLVCRNCVLTVDDLGREIWHHTYCSRSCRTAASVDMLEDDENHRQT